MKNTCELRFFNITKSFNLHLKVPICEDCLVKVEFHFKPVFAVTGNV